MVLFWAYLLFFDINIYKIWIRKNEGIIFRTFPNPDYLRNSEGKTWNIPFMFKKEHKNDRKKLRTLEKSIKICDGNRVPPPINGVLRITWF